MTAAQSSFLVLSGVFDRSATCFRALILLLNSLRTSCTRSAVTRHARRSSLPIGILLLFATHATCPAQTAHFSGTQTSLGSGLYLPQSTAVDAAGNVFIADTFHNRVLKETFASGTYTQSIVAGSLGSPDAVAVDTAGNVYIADTGNNRVLKETPSGSAYSQSTIVSGLYSPQSIAVDASGNIFIADTFNDRVLKETLTAGAYVQTAVVSNFTFPNAVAVDSNGAVYIANGTTGTVYKESPSGGTYTQTVVALGFSSPLGLAVDGSGNVYIADTGNNRIVEEHPSGTVYTQSIFLAALNQPDGVTVDATGTVYIADTNNDRVLKVQAQATDLGTVAIGSASSVFTLIATIDSAGTLRQPAVLTKGSLGLDFADAGSGSCTTKGSAHVYNTGDTCTVDIVFKPVYAGERDGAVLLENAAGVPIATAYIHGIGSGPQLGFPVTTLTAAGSGLSGPSGIAVDGAGNLYIADTNNSRVVMETLSGGNYTQTTVGTGLNTPYSVAVDGAGNLYITDSYNNRVLKETLSNGSFAQSTVVSGLNIPYSVAVDGTGSLYIADTFNNRVLKETLSNGSYIQTTIGTSLNLPFSVALDSGGNVYIGDNNNSDGILKETPAAGGGYTQSTVLAGPPSYGIVVDASGKLYLTQTGSNKILKETPGSGSAYTQTNSSPGLNAPRGVALDDAGNLYVGDYGNNRAVKLDQVDPPSLVFAATDVDMTSTDSPQTVTLHNNGNAPLIFRLPTVSGAKNPNVPANFTWDSAATCTQTSSASSIPFTLAAGLTCTVGFNFQPTSAGTISGSAVLADNTLNAASVTQSIPLSGTGVTPDMTATHVTVSANSIASGGTVNLYATVSDTTNPGNTPTGSVTFYDNGTAPVGAQTISSGQINLTNYTPPGAGNHLITATFTPNTAAYAASADNTGQIVAVGADATGIAVSVSNLSVPFGGSLGISVAIADTSHNGVVPVGTVTFFDNGTTISTAQIGSSNQTSIIYTPPHAGTHTFTANYIPSSSTFAASSDTTGQTVIVAKAPPVINWLTSAPITYGTALSGAQLNATTSIAGTFVYTPAIGTVLGAGTQTLSTTFTPANITDYSSNTASISLTVNQQTTSTTLTESATSGVVGQPVTLTAKVSPAGSGTPTGSVVFFQSFVQQGHYVYTSFATVPLTNGSATYQGPLFGGSLEYLTAHYSGDSNYASNTSNQVNYTILPAISLSLSSATVASGSPVTLTASVQFGDSSTPFGGPVTPGQVQFCDASAPRCTDAHLLGTAQLTSTGIATLKFIPGIGTHSYKAVFSGTFFYPANASPAVPLTVTGIYPSTSVIISSGTVGNYTLTGKVTGTGAAPTGPISFLDTSNANYLLGTATLGPATPTVSFMLSQTPPTAAFPNAIATGDFNGDGKLDLVITGSQANTLTILLGNGNGTFTTGTAPAGFNNPSFVAVADFNSDGKADIAVANTGTNQVYLLFGRGDGTFAAPITQAVGSTPYALTVADLNNDGIPDIAVANTFSNTVSILLGNGDGTFTSTTPVLTTGNGPTSIIAADFNNDGHPDLAVTNLNDASVSLFFGAGDGTFPSSSVLSNVGTSYHLLATDLNSDGNQDLAIAGTYGNAITILLGKGDGTFTAAASPATGPTPNWITAADINGDGIPDLITSNRSYSGSVSVLLGNGDGTYQAALSQAVGSLTNGVVAADFDGDGIPDVATANSGDNTASILLTQLTQAASASLSGISPVGTGTHAVDTTFPGTASLGTSISPSVALTAQRAVTALTLSANLASTRFGQPVTLTATFNPVTAQSHTANAETITFSNGSAILGTGTLSSGIATLTTSALPPGTNTLIATYAADANFTAAISPPLTLAVTRAATTLTLSVAPTGGTVASGTPITLSATLSGPVPLTGGQVRFCDASAASCTGLHLLGTAQLTNTLTASFKFIPGIGTHSYKALFGGSTSSANSLSATASVTVTGKYPTSTSLAASGPSTAYSLTASVTGTGGTAPPTGSVSFLDSTHATTLGSAPLGPATPALNFSNATTPTGTSPQALASADFNGDGIPDLAIANAGDNTVSILLGHGDGTFPAAAAIPVGAQPKSLVAGDFNDDGIADLAVANSGGSVTILLGNGNATFTTATLSGTGTPSAITSADFNGDGIADLALTNTSNNTVTILLGHGDGTFTLLDTFQATGNSPQAIAAADLNGDGIADLAIANNADNTLIILLGQGDGTFLPAASPATGLLPSSVIVADLNGDGILDLAVLGSNTLTILLGKGDGTFTPITSPATGLNPRSLTLGDFNHDGIPDLAVANTTGNTVSILLGKGDGSFTAFGTYPTATAPQAILAADFNGDGTTDLATVNTSANNASVLLAQIQQIASATLPGVTEQGTGTYTAAASYPGDTNDTGSSSNTVSLITVPFPFAALPVFTPGPGTYTSAQTVVLSDSTSSAAIFYTSDGSVPTISSTRYTAPIAVTVTGTINAIAAATGYQTSPTVTSNYVINYPPHITTQPTSQTINAGNTAILTVAATGTAPLTYQWFAGTPPSTASPIAGATSAAYTTSMLSVSSTYWVQVNNASQIPANSQPATITVITPPAITAQPAAQIIATGKTATLTVAATGTAPLTYQWFAGNSPNPATPIAGATGTVFTTPPLNASGNYWVQVNNASRIPANSSTAIITVYALPVCTFSVQPTATVLAAVATVHCSDPQNQALTQTLNWGDGTPPVTPAATSIHTYKAAGTYTVTLIASDPAGLTTTVQQQISPNQSPVCTLGIIKGQVSATLTQYPVSVAASCTDPQNLSFTNISLDWGDGTVVANLANNATYTHTYTSSTTVTYNVVLTAIDTAGVSGSSAPQPVQIVPAQAIAPGGSSPVATTIPAPTITPASPVTPPPTQVTFICSSVSATLNGQTVNNALPSAYGITCTSPAVILTAAPTPVNVTISTTGTVAALEKGPSPLVLCGLIFPFAGFAFIPGKRRRQITALSLIFILSLSLSACGGYFIAPGSTATPSGIYYITLVETVVNPPAPTGFVQTSLIVPLPVTPSAKP